MATDFEEILTGPFEAWIAPDGTQFPDLDETDLDSAGFVLLGANGALNMDEVGVTLAHEQTMEQTYVYGTTAPVAAHRTQESHRIGFTLIDLSVETLSTLLRGVPNDVTDVAAGTGTVGYRHTSLLRGLRVAKHRLLLRGVSAYDPDFAAQYEGFRVFQNANQNATLAKGTPGRWPVEFTMLFSRPDGDDIGRLVMQDAIAS
jgi:hypothetical protein